MDLETIIEYWEFFFIPFMSATIAIVLYVVISVVRKKKKLKGKDKHFVNQKWLELSVLVQESPEHAITEMDKLLDYALGKLHLKGSLGDKLKRSSSLFENIDNVWYAHKVRNKLAHEMDFKLDNKEIERVTKYFYQAFKDLGAF